MQGLQTQEREIDGLAVTTTQLPPVRQLVLSKRLLPIVAPVLAGGAAAIASDAFGEALNKLDDNALVQLMLKTLAGTVVKVDGEMRTLASEDAINLAFAGRFNTMISVMWFAIEVNFFPGGVGDLVASASPLKASR